jgi:hypothetical protein
MSILRNVQRKIHKFSGGFFANWLPPDRVDVGDFGLIKNDRFQRSGSLGDLGLQFEIEQTKKIDGQLKFSDGTKMTIAPSLGAEAPIFKGAKASIALEFSGQGAFLYHLAGINQRRFRNPPEFFKQFAIKMAAGDVVLNDDAVLLDEVKTADKATIVVSESKRGKFDLQVGFKPNEDEFLASAKGKIAANHAYGDFLQWIAAGSTIPLIHPIRPIFSTGAGGSTPLSKFIERIKSALGRKPQVDDIELRYHITGPQFQRFEFRIAAADLSPVVEFRSVSIDEFVKESDEVGNLAAVAKDAKETIAKPSGLNLDDIEKIVLPTVNKKYDYDAS